MAYFLKVGSIKGESLHAPGHMVVLNWSLGVRLAVAPAGQGAGQVNGQSMISELDVVVVPDKGCVGLWKFVLGGTPVKEAVLMGLKSVAANAPPKLFFKLTLTDVYVCSVGLSAAGLAGTDSMQPSAFQLKFNKMLMEYTEYKKDGAAGDKPKVTFDVGKHLVN